MPSRDPNYYRWSMDKPATTNQVYGYGLLPRDNSITYSNNSLRNQTLCTICGSIGLCFCASDTRFRHHSCVQCPDCVRTASRPGAQLCPIHRRRQKTALPSITRFSDETMVKSVNKDYVAGHVPFAKKVPNDVDGRASLVGFRLERVMSSPVTYEYRPPKGKDTYLWHALSGTLVHYKHYEPTRVE